MNFYSFEVVNEKEGGDDGYLAWSPSLQGCFSNRPTVEEARRNMREAVTRHVQALRAQGLPAPFPVQRPVARMKQSEMRGLPRLA